MAELRHRWNQLSTRARIGIVVAVLAIAGLSWQHYAAGPDGRHPAAEPPGFSEITRDHHDHGGGHALGEYQPDPSELPPPPDFSPEAARTTVWRFATNFGSPHGDRDEWLARITADVMPELADQYRLTDIRNVPQNTVLGVHGPVRPDPVAPMFEVAFSDGSAVEATVAMAISGWKVSTVVPVDRSPAVDESVVPQPDSAPTPGPGSAPADKEQAR